MSAPKTLITWSSGFVGFHTTKALLERWDKVVWLDNENSYYDITLKQARRNLLWNFDFYKWSLEDKALLEQIFKDHHITKVINLAAQAWVRYSITNPREYLSSNILGFHNIIQTAQENHVENFVYASSSSVYGKNTKTPFSVEDKVDTPVSLYAATKKMNEWLAHVYSNMYWLPTTGLRFFTVYWPYGRPDMAYFSFTQKILEWKEIEVFNNGNMKRDFTYIDDIVDWIIKSHDIISPYEIFNLWNDNPVQLEHMIDLLEQYIGKKAVKKYLPMQDGDVVSTYADIEHTKEVLGRQPKTSIDKGLEKFIMRYKEYYNIS
jgi:UDP-glucuronate 4-epimerase